MAYMDKIYLTKEQDIAFRAWLEEHKEAIHKETGTNPFNHDYKLYENNPDYTENVFNFPTYIDRYLANHCELPFIHKRLKEQYGGKNYKKNLKFRPWNVAEEIIFDYIENKYQGDISKVTSLDVYFLEDLIKKIDRIEWNLHSELSPVKRKNYFNISCGFPQKHFWVDEILDIIYNMNPDNSDYKPYHKDLDNLTESSIETSIYRAIDLSSAVVNKLKFDKKFTYENIDSNCKVLLSFNPWYLDWRFIEIKGLVTQNYSIKIIIKNKKEYTIINSSPIELTKKFEKALKPNIKYFYSIYSQLIK